MCAAVPHWDEKKQRTGEVAMSIDDIVGIVATVLLLIYLFYTLLRPEKF